MPWKCSASSFLHCKLKQKILGSNFKLCTNKKWPDFLFLCNYFFFCLSFNISMECVLLCVIIVSFQCQFGNYKCWYFYSPSLYLTNVLFSHPIFKCCLILLITCPFSLHFGWLLEVWFGSKAKLSIACQVSYMNCLFVFQLLHFISTLITLLVWLH